MDDVIDFTQRFIAAEHSLKVLQQQKGMQEFNDQYVVYEAFLAEPMKGNYGITERTLELTARRLERYANAAPLRARQFFKLESYEHGDLGTIYFAYVSQFTPPKDFNNVDQIMVIGTGDSGFEIIGKISLAMGYDNVDEFKYFNLDTSIDVTKFIRLNDIVRLQAPDGDSVPYMANGIMQDPPDEGTVESMMKTAQLRHDNDEIDGDDGALAWLDKAHIAGDSNAALWAVPICRDRGRHDEADAWAHKVIDNGDARGYNEIGITRYFQDNKDGNDDSAMAWYRKAAENGVADAYFNLGEVRDEQGRLDPSDDDGAVRWYRESRTHGNADAAERLATLGID